MKNKLIIFDIDDTLYNEIDYVKSGYKVVSSYLEKKYKLNNLYDKMMELFNKSSKNVFNRLLDAMKIEYSKDDIVFLVDLYRNHKPDIKLSDDAIKTLKELKKKYMLAIVSDGNYSTQKLKCDALGLDEYFDKIILTDKYGKEYWKPSRKPFDILSKEFGLSLNDMYYVGDNPNKDFYLSTYGINTIRLYNKDGIYYNENYKEKIREQYKIYRIDSLLSFF